MKTRINANIYGIFCHYYFSRLYMSRLLGVLGHETLHAVNDDGTENPYRDEAEKLKEQGYNQKEINDKLKAKYGDDYTEQVEEDRRAHVFDTKIWNSLSKQFAIFDLEMYDKSKALEQGNEYFNSYLDYNYTMGADLQDSDITPEQAYINKRNFLNSIREKYYSEKENEREQESQQDLEYEEILSGQYLTAMESFYNFRGTYINSIEDNMSEYDINDFNKDLYAAFGFNIANNLEEEQNVLESTNDELNSDFNNLVDSQMETIIINNMDYTEDDMRDFYGNELNNIFNMFMGYDESGETFSLNNTVIENMDVMLNGYSETNGEETEEYDGFLDAFNTDINNNNPVYNNSSVWFLETFHDAFTFGRNADTQEEKEAKINNRQSFFRYYLGCDTNQLKSVTKKLNGKEIFVKDSSINNGISNTHMIANIDLLDDVLTDLHNGTGGENGLDGDWDSFVWMDGFRTGKEATYNSHHCHNNAIDILNINVNGSNIFENGDVDRNAVADLFEEVYDSGHYSEFELKQFGFHWGRGSTSEPTGGYTDSQKKILWGSRTSDTEDTYNYWVNDVCGRPEENFADIDTENWYTYGYQYEDGSYVKMKWPNSTTIDFFDEFIELLEVEEN